VAAAVPADSTPASAPAIADAAFVSFSLPPPLSLFLFLVQTSPYLLCSLHFFSLLCCQVDAT